MAYAEVPADKDLLKAKDSLIKQFEVEAAITDADVKRAVRSILKRRETQFANSEQFATALSEWESYGDWRLYFLHRDRLEKVTPADVQEVAKTYLIQSNRTVGLFHPTENIQARTQTGELNSGLKYALLPKETRGDRVYASFALGYGDKESLKGKIAALEFLPALMQRGTKQLSYQAYRDRLDELKATVRISGSLGRLTVRIQTERDNLNDVLDVVRQALQEPLLEKIEILSVVKMARSQL